ncbi:hypothetical protein ANN_14393 [Periplaneta americana]|uniref:Endonuclease-reverse transcriptase n=1 Tax=Periplaneta americana TaxID=6978 RepID=A0ABQ8SW70_PERAM|nr:hypothetical protein ANN_14393 [Periplaneta americana]
MSPESSTESYPAFARIGLRENPGKTSTRSRIELYKTLIRSIIIYGSENWTFTKKSQNAVDNFERKVLRRIFGPVVREGKWRIRHNHELYSLYNDVALSTFIWIRTLQWAGHIVRMEKGRIPRIEEQYEGKRTVGRPRNRWEDMVEEDTTSLLRLRNWKVAARDKEEWRGRIGEAMARKLAKEP